jgi:hypothetical protein
MSSAKLLQVDTLKIANSSSLTKYLLLVTIVCFFGVVIALCLSIIAFIVNANKSFITLYIWYLLNIWALCGHLQAGYTTYAERPTPRYFFHVCCNTLQL